MDFVLLFVSLGIILAAAEIFTNSVEWLGLRLHLAEGAVGSILAAVGTALPESLIPLIAFLTSKGLQQEQVGIGAIIGAPFMLSTLAFFISGLVVVLEVRKRPNFPRLEINPGIIQREIPACTLLFKMPPGCLVAYQYRAPGSKRFKNGMSKVFAKSRKYKKMVQLNERTYLFISDRALIMYLHVAG